MTAYRPALCWPWLEHATERLGVLAAHHDTLKSAQYALLARTIQILGLIIAYPVPLISSESSQASQNPLVSEGLGR